MNAAAKPKPPILGTSPTGRKRYRPKLAEAQQLREANAAIDAECSILRGRVNELLAAVHTWKRAAWVASAIAVVGTVVAGLL